MHGQTIVPAYSKLCRCPSWPCSIALRAEMMSDPSHTVQRLNEPCLLSLKRHWLISAHQCRTQPVSANNLTSCILPLSDSMRDTAPIQTDIVRQAPNYTATVTLHQYTTPVVPAKSSKLWPLTAFRAYTNSSYITLWHKNLQTYRVLHHWNHKFAVSGYLWLSYVLCSCCNWKEKIDRK